MKNQRDTVAWCDGRFYTFLFGQPSEPDLSHQINAVIFWHEICLPILRLVRYEDLGNASNVLGEGENLMISQTMVIRLLASVAMTCAWGAIDGTSAAPCNTPFVKGNVFASVGDSTVDVFTPTGTLVCTLNDTTGATFTTGSAFDAAGNFYVTNFSGSVSKFDNSGTLQVPSTFFTGGVNYESILFDKSGDAFVGDAGSNKLSKFAGAASGPPTTTFTLAIGPRGTDWTDLSANQTTFVYTSEGNKIKQFDTFGGQLADLAVTLPGSAAFALRIIPDGAFVGDILVAELVGRYTYRWHQYPQDLHASGQWRRGLRIEPRP